MCHSMKVVDANTSDKKSGIQFIFTHLCLVSHKREWAANVDTDQFGWFKLITILFLLINLIFNFRNFNEFSSFCGETDTTLFKFSQSSFSNLPPINRLRAHCK